MVAIITFVIYDIPNTKIRKRIFNVCLDFGLTRIQLSAFQGFLSAENRDALAAHLAKVMEDKKGEVQILTACQADCRNHLRVSSAGASAKRYEPTRTANLFV